MCPSHSHVRGDLIGLLNDVNIDPDQTSDDDLAVLILSPPDSIRNAVAKAVHEMYNYRLGLPAVQPP